MDIAVNLPIKFPCRGVVGAAVVGSLVVGLAVVWFLVVGLAVVGGIKTEINVQESMNHFNRVLFISLEMNIPFQRGTISCRISMAM